MLTRTEPLLDWNDWYRLARDVLDYAPDESVSYANVRYVESRNRELLLAAPTNAKREQD